jgi:arylsulfatase
MRKNILFLMTDQLRADHVGYSGESPVPTPNIDWIAGGSWFSNCRTVDPICTPARTALLTGKYAHQVGMTAMSGDLSLQHPTYPRALQRAGYYTAGVGKFHFLQTWRWGAPRRGGVNLVALKDQVKEYGFDHIWEAAGKQLSRQDYCDYCAYLEERGLLEHYWEFVDGAGKNTKIVGDEMDGPSQGEPSPVPEEDHVDYVTADRIIEAVASRPADKPFFVFGSFCSPHKPFDPPQRYLDAEPPEEELDLRIGDESLSPAAAAQLRKTRRAYRALVRFVDDQVGRVLSSFEDQGLLDSTVVLFTSDHGDLLGDHLRLQKSSAYRESLTVPLAIRLPGDAARAPTASQRRSDAPVEITDVTATILDCAGLDPGQALAKPWPAFHDRVPCRSLLPVLHGEQERIREFTFSECRSDWQCIQDDTHKYVKWLDYETPGSAREELYDLASDPDELSPLRFTRTDESALSEPERATAGSMRARLEWVMDSTPPAQLRWAPLPEAGEEHSYPHPQ